MIFLRVFSQHYYCCSQARIAQQSDSRPEVGPVIDSRKMLEIASANNSGKWRQPKSESWPLFGGDSTFFSQQQKEQPRRTEETTSEKRKSSGGGFGDDGVTSGIDVLWCRGLPHCSARALATRKDNLIHSIVTNVVSRISEVSFESTLHNPNSKLSTEISRLLEQLKKILLQSQSISLQNPIFESSCVFDRTDCKILNVSDACIFLTANVSSFGFRGACISSFVDRKAMICISIDGQ